MLCNRDGMGRHETCFNKMVWYGMGWDGMECHGMVWGRPEMVWGATGSVLAKYWAANEPQDNVCYNKSGHKLSLQFSKIAKILVIIDIFISFIL